MAENNGNSGNNENGGNEKGSYAFGKIAQLEDSAKAVNKMANKSAERSQKKAEKLGSKSFDQSDKAFNLSKNGDAKGAAKANKKANRLMAKSKKKHEKAQKALKLAKKAEKVAKFAAKLGAIITTVILVLIGVFAIIGLMVFIITGWGFIMSGLQQVLSAAGDALHSFVFGNSEKLVMDEQIIDLGSYIEELGYDLYDYGFVTVPDAIVKVDDDVERIVKTRVNNYDDVLQKANDGDEVEQNVLKQAREKVKQENASLYGNASGSDYFMRYSYDKWDSAPDNPYRYLREYLISDNYGTTIKNHNMNLLEKYIVYYTENWRFWLRNDRIVL